MSSETFRQEALAAFAWLCEAGFRLVQHESGYCRYRRGLTTITLILERREIWLQLSIEGEARQFGLAELATAAGERDQPENSSYVRDEDQMKDAIRRMSLRLKRYRDLLRGDPHGMLPVLREAFDARQRQAGGIDGP